MQLKRCFLTIHQGMLDEKLASMRDNEIAMTTYFKLLKKQLAGLPEYHAGALALEIAPKTGTLHVQGYLEHSRKRLPTIAKDLLCGLSNGIMIVKDAQGSWDYCAGRGAYADKHALARHVWGEPKLHGSGGKADLRHLVQLIVDGAELDDIMKSNPYAWCVHRDRLLKFQRDWNFGIE